MTNNTSNNYKYIIAVSGFLLMATTFSIINSVSTLLVAPVTTARGFSLSEYSLLFTINAITIAVCSPIVGALLNKINIKIIMSISSILSGVGYILYGFANNIIDFYIIGVIVSIGVCGVTTIPISTMISDWFEPHKKGSIMGIVFAGIGTGSFFWMQFVSRILENYNYRIVYLLLGSIVLIVSLPISLFLSKRPSFAYIKAKELYNNDSDKDLNKKSLDFKQVSKTPSFWIFSIGLFLMGISFAGVKQHVQSYLSVLGYPLNFNANIGSILAIVGVIANVVGGILFDKYKTKNVLFVLGILTGISIIFLLIANIPTFAYLFAIFYGMTMCVASIWPSFGVSKIFSDDNYSVIFGIANMFMTVGSSIGPFLSGVIADTIYGYQAAWCIYFVLIIIYYSLFIKTVN